MEIEKNAVSNLLGELCVAFGFCLPPITVELMKARAPYELESFLEELMRQEGLDPRLHRTLRRDLKIHCKGWLLNNSESK